MPTGDQYTPPKMNVKSCRKKGGKRLIANGLYLIVAGPALQRCLAFPLTSV
jgi:hypothetical protein